MGKWAYEAMSKSYLTYFKPSGLLGAAAWPGAAQNDYHQFWHPRFCVEVPEALIQLLFPQLDLLKEVGSHSSGIWLSTTRSTIFYSFAPRIRS